MSVNGELLIVQFGRPGESEGECECCDNGDVGDCGQSELFRYYERPHNTITNIDIHYTLSNACGRKFPLHANCLHLNNRQQFIC